MYKNMSLHAFSQFQASHCYYVAFKIAQAKNRETIAKWNHAVKVASSMYIIASMAIAI